MLPLMRRSTMWFLIAAFWLIDGAIAALRHVPRQAALVFAIALAFAAIGAGYRRSEARRPPTPRSPGPR